jgi:hypothetical protein
VLTVSIAINGRPIFTRSVVNRLAEIGYYVSDDGNLIEHNPADGAVELAVKALRGVYADPDVVVKRAQAVSDPLGS